MQKYKGTALKEKLEGRLACLGTMGIKPGQGRLLMNLILDMLLFYLSRTTGVCPQYTIFKRQCRREQHRCVQTFAL